MWLFSFWCVKVVHFSRMFYSLNLFSIIFHSMSKKIEQKFMPN